MSSPSVDRTDQTQAAAPITTPLPRRKFFSDMPDKGLFALVSVVGFSLILTGKRYGANGDFMTVAAVVAMLIYGSIAFSMPRVKLRLDRLGDNFYYLGFIFTLASLSASLLQLRGGADTQFLLENFGFALTTTIVGIAGRVLFVQLRGDLDDIEEELRQTLLETSAELKASLAHSLADFETFRTGVLQATKEATQTTITQLGTDLATVSKDLNNAGQKVSSAIETYNRDVAALTTAVNAMRAHFEAASRTQEERALARLPELISEISQLSRSLDKRLPPAKTRDWRWPFRSRKPEQT